MNDAATTDYLRRFAEPGAELVMDVAARATAAGVPAMPAEVGSLVRFLAAQLPARIAVEVGGCGGTSGLWLAGGMAERATLTSIEATTAGRELSREAFTRGQVADHVRSILGTADQVLPRLADHAYDLAVLSEDPRTWAELLPELHRILRPGGLLVASGVLAGGRVADPAITDPAVTAIRTFNATIRDDEHWSSTLLPLGDGVLLARTGPSA